MSLEVGRFEQQIAPLLAELHASANAHDTDRHLAVLWRDPALIFIINGEVIRGWDALREQQLSGGTTAGRSGSTRVSASRSMTHLARTPA
jgi:hypothetical protein